MLYQIVSNVFAFSACARIFRLPLAIKKRDLLAPRTPSDGEGLLSRANARDLRKISPGVYPELAEGVEMTKRGPFSRS